MLDTFTIRKEDMPEDMRFLLDTYPRDSWEAHPGFKEKTRHWLGAHLMFRLSWKVLARGQLLPYSLPVKCPSDDSGYYGMLHP